MMKFLNVRRWKKGNRTNFYRVILLIHINSIEVLKNFDTVNYTQRLDIVQKSYEGLVILPQKTIHENLI